MSDIFAVTDEFEEKLLLLIDVSRFDNSPKIVVSDIACSMSFEHWIAVRRLLEGGLLPSAVVTHRAQFEALLRSIWLLYVATDEQITKLSVELTMEAEQNAKNLPQAADMLAAIKISGPPQAYDALNRFKENSWKAMNSYAHAGIHPLKRHADGYPTKLATNVAKNANGLAVLAAMQTSVLSGMAVTQKAILDLATQYAECMPAPL